MFMLRHVKCLLWINIPALMIPARSFIKDINLDKKGLNYTTFSTTACYIQHWTKTVLLHFTGTIQLKIGAQITNLGWGGYWFLLLLSPGRPNPAWWQDGQEYLSKPQPPSWTIYTKLPDKKYPTLPSTQRLLGNSIDDIRQESIAKELYITNMQPDPSLRKNQSVGFI